MRANIYEFLATGFEEIEALTPVTVMRQGGQNFKLVSMTGSVYVETANGAWLRLICCLKLLIFQMLIY